VHYVAQSVREIVQGARRIVWAMPNVQDAFVQPETVSTPEIAI
jgi:hypothetical protein